MTLRGNKAIVTGGSRGIGFAIARRLLEAGAQAVITGRDMKRLEEAAAKMHPFKPHIMEWDATDIQAIKPNIDKAVSLMDGFDILVNNAGVNARGHEWNLGALEMTEAEWDEVTDINLKSVFFMIQAAARYMIDNKVRGNILNISSVAAYQPVACGAYGASKAGVYAFTRSWGKNLAAYGIIVNGIAPGVTATSMNSMEDGEFRSHTGVPLGRYADPKEIAELAAFLLSREGEYIVAHNVTADGGYAVK